MKNIYQYKKVLVLGGALLFLFVFNLFITWTWYNPAVMVPVYGWLAAHNLAETAGNVLNLGQKEEQYPLISIEDLEKNLFWGPRAAAIGTVTDVVRASDGDHHINVKDEKTGRILVAETVPEYSLPLPEIGQKIKIWGVTRFDIEHRWWELHPVFGWEKSGK